MPVGERTGARYTEESDSGSMTKVLRRVEAHAGTLGAIGRGMAADGRA